MSRALPGIWALLLAASCTGLRKPPETIDSPIPPSNRYATRFEVRDLGGCTLLQVSDPWQNSRDVRFSYILGWDASGVPDSLSALPFIRVPVRRVVTTSTTHVAMIRQLDREESICAASGTDFIYDPGVRQRVKSGGIREIGYGQALDYEAILALEPDVFFLYGVEGHELSVSGKLSDLGVPVVFCAEYLEEHPLGRAEWIRFFAQFYGLEARADQFFRDVDSSYCQLERMTATLEERPLVMTGLPWKDTWYVAGGSSYAARLIGDAGGSYLWKEESGSEAVPMDLESVYTRAIEADVWINPGSAGSLGELVEQDERFGSLPVVRAAHVYNNNARMSGGGGNDYWESGTVRPDVVLKDLIAVFHPGLQPDHSLFYYRKLK